MVDVQVVIPCRDEAAALPWVLSRIPPGYSCIVVDNGSGDGTAGVARRLGARVVSEPLPGYGRAVHAGLLACKPGPVAVLDGDASLDPHDLPALVEVVVRGGADMAVGRRRPRQPGTWPWHARLANRWIAGALRRRGLPVHDIAPMRVADRDALLSLGVRDRRCGYPLELLLQAAGAGWRVVERDVGYHRRASGTRSKVSGSLRGTLHATIDFRRALRGAAAFP